ncbi:MAG: hypothetical protein WKG07_47215 [Hymenobacter sp.]
MRDFVAAWTKVMDSDRFDLGSKVELGVSSLLADYVIKTPSWQRGGVFYKLTLAAYLTNLAVGFFDKETLPFGEIVAYEGEVSGSAFR